MIETLLARCVVVILVAAASAPSRGADTTAAVPLRVEVVPDAATPPLDGPEPDARVVGVADLTAALRSLRAQRGPDRPVEVTLRGGIYRLDAPLVLEAVDSGTEGAPLHIRAASGEHPVLSGAVPVRDWREAPERAPIDGPPLPVAAQGRLWTAKLDPRQRADWGEITPRGFGRPRTTGPAQLLWRGTPLTLARWPRDSYLGVIELPDGKKGRRVTIDRALPLNIAEEPDLWAFGYWGNTWAGQHQPIAALDVSTRTMTLGGPAPTYGLRTDMRVAFLYNGLSLVDHPGAWWLDRRDGTLWLWPPGPIEPGDLELTRTDTLLRVEGARHVHLDGLRLEASRGDAVVLDSVVDVRLRDCTIRNIGGIAIKLSGSDSGIEGCLIEEVGDSAVRLEGGDRQTLEPGRLFVRDSEIRRYGQWVRTYTAAIELHGVGHGVLRNRFHDAPHMGIYVFGNDHRIEGNLFYDLIKDTSDAGAIYQYLDWTARGTAIINNIICRLYSSRDKAMGVYLDAFSSGATVAGNRIMDVPYAILMNGGSDNHITGNLIVGGTAPLWIDASGLRWLRYHFAKPGTPLLRALEAVPYKGPIYSRRYPGLASVLDDDPGMPKRNVITGNRIAASSIGRIDARLDGSSEIRDNTVVPHPSPEDIAGFPVECHPDR